MSVVKIKSYEYHDVYVTSEAKAGSRIAFVSFSAWSSSGVGTIFGSAFFRANGIPAYFVVQRKNVWYQTPDIKEISSDIIAHAANLGYSLVLYGASMGGYAAVNHRVLFNAIHSVAIAPQVMISLDNASFESRWIEERKNIPLESFAEANGLSRQTVPLLVFFDPRHLLDSKHIDCLMQVSKASVNSIIEVPYANHDVARALVKSKVIQQHLIAIAKGESVEVGAVALQCADLFKKDCKAFLNYYRSKAAVEHIEAGDEDYLRFVSFATESKCFDFESCYMAAEIYARLNNQEQAIELSLASLDRYPREIPTYLKLKHAGILRKFGVLENNATA